MELRDLLTLDVSTLSAGEARFVSGDIVRVMTTGGITGADQQKLKTLLVEVNRKTLPPPETETPTRVKQLIEEAEARGDERTAQMLADSMVKSDVAELPNVERLQKAIEATNKHWADQTDAKEAASKRQHQELIDARTQELLYAHGDRPNYSVKKAREEATREVVGHASFQDLGESA